MERGEREERVKRGTGGGKDKRKGAKDGERKGRLNNMTETTHSIYNSETDNHNQRDKW